LHVSPVVVTYKKIVRNGMRKIVVGCRKSALALTQTEQVISDLTLFSQAHGMEFTFELKKIVTRVI